MCGIGTAIVVLIIGSLAYLAGVFSGAKCIEHSYETDRERVLRTAEHYAKQRRERYRLRNRRTRRSWA